MALHQVPLLPKSLWSLKQAEGPRASHEGRVPLYGMLKGTLLESVALGRDYLHRPAAAQEGTVVEISVEESTVKAADVPLNP